MSEDVSRTACVHGRQQHELCAECIVEKSAPHPEDFCQKCGGRNITWFAPNSIWNQVVPDREGILCPVCFVKQAEDVGLNLRAWCLSPETGVLVAENTRLQGELDRLGALYDERTAERDALKLASRENHLWAEQAEQERRARAASRTERERGRDWG